MLCLCARMPVLSFEPRVVNGSYCTIEWFKASKTTELGTLSKKTTYLSGRSHETHINAHFISLVQLVDEILISTPSQNLRSSTRSSKTVLISREGSCGPGMSPTRIVFSRLNLYSLCEIIVNGVRWLCPAAIHPHVLPKLPILAQILMYL